MSHSSVNARTDFRLCGWRVRSELPLPDDLAWAGPDQPVDIDIRLGTVPDTLINAVQVTPFLQVAGNGDCRLEVSAAGRYLVKQGREVVVQPAPDATFAEVHVFLLGTVFGLLCHQRGLLPLHASCVRIGDGAVAFCGSSGAGKSTLAASLVRRGHALVADDVTAIDIGASGGSMVLPAMPRMRLWRDALKALAVSHEPLQRDRIELEKYALPAKGIGQFLTEPLPLRAIFLLKSVNASGLEGASSMPAMETVALLAEQIYRRRHAEAMGRKGELFQGVARIANTVPVRRLTRQLDLGQLDEVAAMVEGLVGA